MRELRRTSGRLMVTIFMLVLIKFARWCFICTQAELSNQISAYLTNIITSVCDFCKCTALRGGLWDCMRSAAERDRESLACYRKIVFFLFSLFFCNLAFSSKDPPRLAPDLPSE